MVKIGHLDDSSLNIFLPQASREKANHSSKKKTKGKKRKKKTFQKSKSLKL